ncbi:hypothetical protein O59_003170 [Cellvibrio sp. BR]|nr:hypothetical protein O59_003170 [Cellvibrio sp. BR]
MTPKTAIINPLLIKIFVIFIIFLPQQNALFFLKAPIQRKNIFLYEH